MIFKEVAQVFDLISQESSRIKITQLLAQLFKQANAQELAHISYLALGTLHAPYLANQFNFAEKNIIKTIAQLLQVDIQEVTQLVKKTGDIGLALTKLSWPYQDTGLSVEDIYEQLSNLQAISGTGSQEEKSGNLARLLTRVDALSASYIIRIIMGTMRLGFSDMTLIDALSWMITGDKSLRKQIEDSFNICADIGVIAKQLKQEGPEGLKHIKPILGIPIRPAAAERAVTAQVLFDRLGPCIAQPKLDGFRLQIHIDNSGPKPAIYFFSRNLLDMSSMFPDLVAALQHIPVTNIIVEGEAIVYDEASDSFVPFQETVKRKRKHNIEEVAQELPLRLYLFDILFLNNNILLDKSHTERRKLLEYTFGNYNYPVIQVIEEHFCSDVRDLDNYFNKQITAGLEGLVVKRPEANYQPGKRNFNWIKLKRHQEGHLSDTLDLVVLGYYTGCGKRAAFGIGAFLVGVYNANLDTYETVCKIGTGVKDAEWLDLKARCDAIAVDHQPANIICAPELAPDVWVTPNIVVIVYADEITQSPLHKAGADKDQMGLALRFPRFTGYSIDKLPQQATTVSELKELYKQQFM